MWKIQISDKARLRIENHADALWKYYDNLFTDTGMGVAEDIIKSQYKESSNILRDGIYDRLVVVLEREQILGYSYNSESQVYTITTSVGTRRLFIEYKEYNEENIRVVLDVQILQK